MCYNDWQPLGDLSHPSENRVFLKGTTVVKFYDLEHQQIYVPNQWLINETRALPALELQALTADGRIVALKYASIEGDHKPQALWQFANVAKILASIQWKEYVHGDVRKVDVTSPTDQIEL